MGVAAPETKEDFALKTAFDAGWDGALDEAIVILETAEVKGQSLQEAIADLRQYREDSR